MVEYVLINDATRAGYKDKDWIEVFGIYYRRHFIDEDHNRVLRMNKSLFVQWEYLEEL